MVSVDIEGSLGWRLVNGEEFQWSGVAKDEGGTQAGLIWDGDEMLNVDPLFCADRFGEKFVGKSAVPRSIRNACPK